jgi:hypothetical protein
MQLGNAEFGDEGDEGREPPPLGPRVWERRWVSRDAIYWGCKFGFRPGRTARAIAAGSPADKKTGCPRLPPAATACSPPPSCSTTTAQRAVHLSCSRFFFLFALPPPLPGHYWRSCTAGHGGKAKGCAGVLPRGDWLRAGAFGCTAVAAIPSTAGIAALSSASPEVEVAQQQWLRLNSVGCGLHARR